MSARAWARLFRRKESTGSGVQETNETTVPPLLCLSSSTRGHLWKRVLAIYQNLTLDMSGPGSSFPFLVLCHFPREDMSPFSQLAFRSSPLPAHLHHPRGKDLRHAGMQSQSLCDLDLWASMHIPFHGIRMPRQRGKHRRESHELRHPMKKTVCERTHSNTRKHG